MSTMNTTVETPGNVEIKAIKETIANLDNYKSKNWGIGLNGSTFQPDGFLTFFTQRNLPFQYYVVNYGASIGSSAAYDQNINTLKALADKIREAETAKANKVIADLQTYKANFWAIGLNGDTLQPDGFNNFFAERQLTFKPFVRSTSGVNIGEQSAYDENIRVLQDYIKGLG